MTNASAQLAALKARFIAGLPDRLKRMQALQPSPSAQANFDSKHLQREAHSLVGAAGIHGLDALASSAARLNQALLHQEPAEFISSRLTQLAESIQQVSSPLPPKVTPVSEAQTRIAVICQGDDERESLRALLEGADWIVDTWADPNMAKAQGKSEPSPYVLLLSLQFGASTSQGLQAIGAAAKQWPQAAILVTTAHSDLFTRLAALRAGAASVMVKPFEPEALLQRIQQLRSDLDRTDPVLVVTPHEAAANPGDAIGTPWPAHWHMVHSVAALSAALDQGKYEAIVLSGQLPDVAPDELTILLLDGPSGVRMPVVWHTPHPGPYLHAQAACAGASAVVDAQQPLFVLVAVVGQHTRQAHIQNERMQRLQSALYERNQQQMALDHHATVSIADAHGLVIDTTPQHARLTGRELEHLMGAHLCEPRSGKAPPELPPIALQTARDKGIWQGRLQLTKMDQSPCWVDATLVPFVDPGGDVYRYLLARSDVTRQVLNGQTIERLRQAELDTASIIQSTLLVPPLPHCPSGVSVAARFQASVGVAGDFHELLEHQPGVFDVLIGDVMGKGVPAGLIGAAVKLELVRCLAELRTSHLGELVPPATIVQALHQRLTPRLMTLDTYVTLSYLRLEPAQHRLTSVGCGHPQTLVVHGGTAHPLPNNNLPLGILADENYTETVHELPPGATVVMYSDGLTEATNSVGEAFGPQRLMQAVCKLAEGHSDARLTANGLLDRIHTYSCATKSTPLTLANETPLSDDQTLVVLRVPLAGEQLFSLPRSLHITKLLRQTVSTCEALREAGDSARDRLCIAAVEVFSNIVRHGQASQDDPTINLSIARSKEGFDLELTDSGTPYLFTGQHTPSDPQTGAEGGYGIALIRAACDEVRYTSLHGINRCWLRIAPDA